VQNYNVFYLVSDIRCFVQYVGEWMRRKSRGWTWCV